MRAGQRVEGGKFCRNGINCRGYRTILDTKTPCFIGFSAMARRLLIDRRGKFGPRVAAFVGVLSMLLALGAASSALDALKSLTASISSASQSTGQDSNPFDISSSASAPASPAPAAAPGGCSQIAPATMSALLAAQSQSSTGTTNSASASPSDALKDLFSQIDTNGDGQLSESEFENALGAGGTNLAQADDVFNKLDTNGDGSVSLGEMSSALKGAGGKGHHHHAHVGGSGQSGDSSSSAASSADGSNSDPLLQALAGASSTSVTNSDGSTTTSMTYADGSKVTMTSPAAKTASSTATSSYNLIEQMIQREAQSISFSAANPSLSFSV
jgi:EF-hand domain pair